MANDRRNRNRHGVLLLIILALLAMFGATAIAFVILTRSQKSGANAFHQEARETEDAEKLLTQAMAQVLHGTNNPQSVIGAHSLLEDVYGNRFVEGQLTASPVSVAPGTGGEAQLNEIAATSLSYECVGGLLTFLSGNCKGKTTRIVGRNPDNGNYYILVNGWNAGDLQAGDQFFVNSAPFSGTGFGFGVDASEPRVMLRQKSSGASSHGFDWLTAFLPRASENSNPPGGANEDYDAVDYQNWLLSTGRFLDLDDDPSTPDVLIPSLHRPEIVDYWFRQMHASTVLKNAISDDVQRWKAIVQPWGTDGKPGTADDYAPDVTTGRMIADLKRMFLFRPTTDDHHGFTGSNPNAYPNISAITDLDVLQNNCWEIVGPWDVDNDGDGKPDSIWVDLGLPVRSTTDGRLYKPLFAILCVDLDGRLNLNAHGCLAQCDSATYDTIDSSPYVFGNGTTTASTIHRGQGYGPADINLRGLFSDPREYSYLLYGRKIADKVWLDGRYGESYPLADGVDSDDDKVLDNLRQVGPGYASSDDPQSRNRFVDCVSPFNYSDYSVPKAYGSPPDFKASMAVGLDVRGQPLYLPLTDRGVNTDAFAPEHRPYALLTANDPYEINLFQSGNQWLETPARVDNPFAISELEWYLRFFDVDAPTLRSRLPILAPSLASHRHRITTASWHVPSAPVAIPDELRGALDNVIASHPVAHFVYLLRARNVSSAHWRSLIPLELLAGQRMDLNRPFGNGQDDLDPSGRYNGVVDEPSEVADPNNPADQTRWEKIRLADGNGVEVATINFDHCNGIDVDGDGDVDANDRMLARQLYARYLYVLAILLSDNIYDSTGNLDLSETEAEKLAQWAVNVVDFRDRDSIMTRFEYDGNPLDGWNPTDVVWGCERPELLLTETLALHDRRTEDLELAGGGKYHTADPSVHDDNHFDQRIYPEGSLFVELYNPWTSMEPPPGEFYYDYANQAFDTGVRLNQATPSGDPVWRMLIAEPSANVNDPADPDSSEAADHPTVDRSVYFIQPNSDYDDGANVRYYRTAAADIAPILPGRYAVIGPGDEGATTSTTYLGFQTSDAMGTGTPAPRRIQLTPNSGASQWQVASYPFTDDEAPAVNEMDPASMPAQPPVSVIIDGVTNVTAGRKPPRFSVSEPTNGYPLYDPDDDTATQYLPPRDEPLDWDFWDNLPTEGSQANGMATEGGVIVRYRVIYLQRLANPLLPYDANTNPYRTVDSMQIDLCAFNGITNDIEEDKVAPFVAAQVFTRERGVNNEADALNRPNLWSAEPETIAARTAFDRPPGEPGAPGTVQSHFFNAPLGHSLGWLNSPFGNPRTSGGPGDMYKGDPPTPFPWLAWPNRPFVNEMELLNVPSQRSSQLLRHYSIGRKSDSPYDSTDALTDDTTDTSIALRHLFPYFRQDRPNGMPSRMYRLLECVHVPTRFSDADITLSPERTSVYNSGNGFMFRPPFNRVSKYREPGRVNINTVFDDTVWNGVLNGHPGPNYDQIRLSRRGYAAGRPADCPTEFANPFRSIAGYYLVPTSGAAGAPIDGIQEAIGDEVNATLMRQDQFATDPPDRDKPLFRHESTDLADETGRNPYFRYEPLQHIANLVTTKSNVYAVWITVGFFEVDQVGTSSVHPDGYALGQELGSDTGEIKRHRAFYIIDRSIPVGFRRGEDLNSGNCVLLKRFIE